jgi:hypothetical protein
VVGGSTSFTKKNFMPIEYHRKAALNLQQLQERFRKITHAFHGVGPILWDGRTKVLATGLIFFTGRGRYFCLPWFTDGYSTKFWNQI